jgi:TonB family protein
VRILFAGIILSSVVFPANVDAVWKYMKEGKALSAAAAAGLERNVESHPGDSPSRIKLLAYYAAQVGTPEAATAKSARLKHILWLIEKDPKEGFGVFEVATGIARVNCQGDALADPESFDQAVTKWSEAVSKHSKDDAVRLNAARFVETCKPERAVELVLAANNHRELGRLYALILMGASAVDYESGEVNATEEAARSSTLARRVRETVTASGEARMVAGTAEWFLRECGNLWADGKLEWNYTPLGKELWTRAIAMAPEDFGLRIVSTELPARGERPPMTVRVGGKVQAAMLVHKVVPRYPPEAKARRIAGAVLFTVLLDLEGNVAALNLESGPPELVQAAANAVRQWKYNRTLVDDKPCYVITSIEINFDISRR